MEQNNFMMNGGNMMQTHMQRPQPGNEEQQIFAKIVEELSRNRPKQGWQATMDVRERAALVLQL